MRADCPLCGGSSLVACFDRPRSPAFQNALFATREAALSAAVAPIAIRACAACGFVFNAAFGKGVSYDGTYENDQTFSPAFARHVDGMAQRILAAVADRAAPVLLEVGCGQGYFLERVVALAGRGVRAAFGFDPAWRGGETRAPIEIHARYFDATAAKGLPSVDAAFSRHVIEHVDEPVGFLTSIAGALPKGARLFVETPCVQWILDGGVLQDFFFEHCSYFTADTLRQALERGGFDDVSTEHVFDGQYLWAAARVAGTNREPGPEPASVDRVTTAGRRFAERQRGSVERWGAQIATLPQKVAVWGAGAKGVTFVNNVDPEASLVDCVIDINPKKQGSFVPVTAHAIVSPADARARGVRSLVIMNPNYRHEIERSIAEQGLGFEQLFNA